MATIIVTGGTGMIGRVLVGKLIAKGHQVIIFTRHPPARNDNPRVRYAAWDILSQTIDMRTIAEADHIIHLAGANVAEKRWTKKRKQEIVDSRVQSGNLLVKALLETPNRIQSIISASAIGWYGPDPVIPNPEPFTEEQPAHEGFLGQTCRQWEASLQPLIDAGKRVVLFRTGIVLGREGGVIKEFSKPLNAGIATILGNGRQMMSWIHIDDLVRLYMTAIDNNQWQGVYNAVAPRPVSNKDLVLEIAHARRGKLFIPIYVPAFVLKIVLGEMSIEVLKSATVSCAKVHVAGFTFQYPDHGAAITQLFSK